MVLEELGHIPCWVDKTQTGWVYCSICSARWNLTQSSKMAKGGTRCQGPNTWGPPPTLPGRHWVVQPGCRLVHNGHAIHPSHTVKWCRGLLYCDRCGSYTATVVKHLLERCLLKPTNRKTGLPCPTASNRLKRIREGIHPTGGKWPQDVGTATPDHIAMHIVDQRWLGPPADPLHCGAVRLDTPTVPIGRPPGISM